MMNLADQAYTIFTVKSINKFNKKNKIKKKTLHFHVVQIPKLKKSKIKYKQF